MDHDDHLDAPAAAADPGPGPMPGTTPAPPPVAIVTGASRGLGLALANALAADGWEVVVDARDSAALRRAAATIGPRAHSVPGDVTDPAHRGTLVEVATRLGRLDLLVNNAGTLGPSPLPAVRDLPPVRLAEIFEANVLAPLALAQAALPMLRSAGGAIVDVTSDAAVEAYEGWGGYGASKAALEHLGRVLAVEEPTVRVWTVDPGDMRTRMHQDAFPGEDISDRPEPEHVVPAFRRLLRDRPPSGRIRAADLLQEAAR